MRFNYLLSACLVKNLCKVSLSIFEEANGILVSFSKLGTRLKFKQTKPGKTKTILVNVYLTWGHVNEILLLSNGFSI